MDLQQAYDQYLDVRQRRYDEIIAQLDPNLDDFERHNLAVRQLNEEREGLKIPPEQPKTV